ncbi:MAG: HNH endonuclease signature motif containing protein [Chloroflexota bacterium]
MPRYDETKARAAVAVSRSYSEVLRRLGMRPAGGNHSLLRKYVDEVWRIPTDHFDAGGASMRNLHKPPIPLEEVLVVGSTYSRGKLKERLFEAGLKERRCEQCGQDESWRGRSMSLILDHINGVPDDNRIENLQVVCPNCAATLDTHCGRKNRREPVRRPCKRCGKEFTAKYRTHKYCSRSCGVRWDRARLRGLPHPSERKVARPPYEQLLEEIEATSYLAVGRKCGVSDNAVRKWVRFYERQREREAAELEAAGGR